MTLLTLFLLLVIFHRPIFFEGTRYFVLRAAKQQKLDLDYEMRGSIFTTLSVVNLKATPIEPGPIQRLEIGTLNLRYSIWDLVRSGLPAFLRELDVRNVFVELTPGEPLPPEKDAEPQAFKFPAIFPELLNIENVNLIVHAPTGDTVLEGLFFSLLPERPGALKIQTLDIPGVRRWVDIKAETTFRDRNLLLTGLFIDREIALEKFQLNMSELEKNELGVALNGTFFDAPTSLTAQVSDLNASSRTTLKADVRNLAFEPVWKYLNLTVPVQGELGSLAVTFAGEPLKPASWTGEVKTRLKDLATNGQALGQVEFSTTMKDGQAQLAVRDVVDEKNSVTLAATATLPEKMDGFATTKAQGQLEVIVPEAGLLKLPEPVAGDLAVKADFQINDGLLKAKAAIDSRTLAAAGAELTETHFIIGVEKDLTQPAEAPAFRTLVSSIEGGITKVRFQDYTADDVKLKLTSRDGQVALQELALSKETNSVRAYADYVLPDDLQSWDRQPLKLDLAVEAPNLSAFLAPDAGVSLKGNLKIAGKAEMREKVVNGTFAVEGSGIDVNGLPVRTLNAQVGVAENRVKLSALDVVMDDKNRVQGDGEVQLGEALSYWGGLNVQLTDLAIFQPLLGAEPDAPKLGGKLTAYWKGSGDVKTPQHYGTASLDLTGGQFAEQKNLTAHFNASYAPDHINIPDLVATSDLATAALSLFWKDNRLSITNLTVTQKKLTLIEGSAELPLHLAGSQKPEDFIPPHDPLTVNLKTRDLDLRTLFLQLGEKKSPLLGRVNLDIAAQGTTDDLVAKVALRATGVQSTEAEQFAPAEISIDLTAKDDRVGLDGTVRQKLIEPLRITGNLPFDGATAVRSGSLDPATPVQAQVSLPRSSLAFVASLIPAIRQSRGTAAIDVRLNGTVGNPQFDGTVNADLEALRFTDPSLPPVSRFGLRVNFTHNQLRIERCAGSIGGGTFQVGGGVTFTALDNPVFNLQLGCRNALVLQNDDMTARISSDVRVTGPLKAGTVAGTVWVTRSRFFKNVDILPIGLPGRPAPQPPEEPTIISFPQPPLRDWKFDIAIKTADPFLVQSNLATGRIFIDLHLGGTGLEPWMDGTINIERLVASLPFSRLTIQSGQVFFTRQRPFIPQLNLRGTSTVRDYNVSVFITGPVTEPEAFFSSEPPLPQADVVSLLATGMTTTELGRDPNALAGRAAILVFQKLYNSVFRRNRPPPENDSFLSRIQFDIGTTDPKTGRQSTTLGIPLSDRIMLTGGLDVGGNFRGQVKYLIRFK